MIAVSINEQAQMCDMNYCMTMNKLQFLLITLMHII